MSSELALQTKGVRFERSGLLGDRYILQSLLKDATELHYGTCSIQRDNRLETKSKDISFYVDHSFFAQFLVSSQLYGSALMLNYYIKQEMRTVNTTLLDGVRMPTFIISSKHKLWLKRMGMSSQCIRQILTQWWH